MEKTKIEKLKSAGLAVTDTREWLGPSEGENTLVNIRINLAREVGRLYRENGYTQKQLAEELGTKQSGIARMLNNPAGSTIDALVRALLALGSSPRKIAALF